MYIYIYKYKQINKYIYIYIFIYLFVYVYHEKATTTTETSGHSAASDAAMAQEAFGVLSFQSVVRLGYRVVHVAFRVWGFGFRV